MTSQNRVVRLAPALALATLFLHTSSGVARAQAFVPSQGEGSVSLQFQNSLTKDHYFSTVKADIGQIDSSAIVVDATYGLTDRVAIDVSLPYIAAKYTGLKPHPSVLDDGTYHETFQDLRLVVRYNVLAGRFAVTPFVGSIIPSHNYEYFAHAAPGRDLKELQVGTYVAKILDPYVPGAFVQARIGYGFAEKAIGISHNRAMADLEIGYFATQSLRVFALGTGQVTNGGYDIPVSGTIPADIKPYHDQIDRVNFLNVGLGAAVSLRDSLDLFGSVLTNQANRNGHALNRGVTVGVTYSFKKSGKPSALDVARADALTDRKEAEKHTLVRCMCQRGE